MGRDLTENEKLQLEQLIDGGGLCAVLQALSTICDEKADHITQSYGYGSTAKMWRSAAGVLGVASCDSRVMAIGEP